MLMIVMFRVSSNIDDPCYYVFEKILPLAQDITGAEREIAEIANLLPRNDKKFEEMIYLYNDTMNVSFKFVAYDAKTGEPKHVWFARKKERIR